MKNSEFAEQVGSLFMLLLSSLIFLFYVQQEKIKRIFQDLTLRWQSWSDNDAVSCAIPQWEHLIFCLHACSSLCCCTIFWLVMTLAHSSRKDENLVFLLSFQLKRWDFQTIEGYGTDKPSIFYVSINCLLYDITKRGSHESKTTIKRRYVWIAML